MRAIAGLALCLLLLPAMPALGQFETNDSDEPFYELVGEITDKGIPLNQTLTFYVWSGDSTVPVTATNLPTGAVYTDNGDGTGIFEWMPRSGQEGINRVTFSTTAPPLTATAAGDQEAVILVRARPLSRGLYRSPYDDGQSFRVNSNFDTHSGPGKFDIVALPQDTSLDHAIVAVADGRIINLNDGADNCCWEDACNSCQNSVQIRHTNGDVARYVHIEQNSATNVGLSEGDCVVEGQFLGWEGDVGHTKGKSHERVASPCPGDPDVNTDNFCGTHLHFELRSGVPGEWTNRLPLWCGVLGGVYADNGEYTGMSCAGLPACPDLEVVNGQLFDGDQVVVFQANFDILSANTVVDETASVAMFAGQRVVLSPGFHAKSNTYFNARIMDCNEGSEGCPAP